MNITITTPISSLYTLDVFSKQLNFQSNAMKLKSSLGKSHAASKIVTMFDLRHY